MKVLHSVSEVSMPLLHYEVLIAARYASIRVFAEIDADPSELPKTAPRFIGKPVADHFAVDTTSFRGEYLSPALRGKVIEQRSVSFLNLNDPGIKGEWSDHAAWFFGMRGSQLRPPYNRFAKTAIDKRTSRYHLLTEGLNTPLMAWVRFADDDLLAAVWHVRHHKDAVVAGVIFDGECPIITGLSPFLPTLKMTAPATVPIASPGMMTVQLELVENDGTLSPIERDVTVYLETTAGYLPKQRVRLIKGKGQANIWPMGLAPGDEIVLRAGLGFVNGLAKVTLTVV